MDRKKAQANALNLGFGNGVRVVQDIGTVADFEYNQIKEDFMGDMLDLNNQRSDAYANLQRTYNNITPTYEPSFMSLALDIGGAGADYMSKPSNDRRFFKTYGNQGNKNTITAVVAIIGDQSGYRKDFSFTITRNA